MALDRLLLNCLPRFLYCLTLILLLRKWDSGFFSVVLWLFSILPSGVFVFLNRYHYFASLDVTLLFYLFDQRLVCSEGTS